METDELQFLKQLEDIIGDRIANGPAGSYTTELVAAGAERVAQKVGEEAVELALASVTDNRTAVVDEAADLVYHLLVLLHSNSLSLRDVCTTLKQRHRERPSGKS